MRTPRLPRRKIPKQLKLRQKEILGEIRADTMPDCVYNSLLAGEIADVPPLANTKDLIAEAIPNFEPKKYQVEDLSIALGRRAVFNINKPGYGKTIETILWIKINLQRDFKALVLCPKSVISSWHNQLNKYWPGWAADGMWWITNYEQLYAEERLSLALQFEWDVIVLDESHTIKSFKSKITEIVFKLRGGARHCLTGTPIKNRPEDLASQLKWLDNSSVTSFTDFQFAFCDMQRDGWGYKPNGLTRSKQMVENLQSLLSLYCVGGEEHDIGAIEKPEYVKVRLKLDPKVKKLYQQTVGEWSEELQQRVIDTEALLAQGVKISNSIEAVTRRQQIASNCQLFNDEFINVKFDWIVDWLKGTEEKVVIFSKYAETIDKLEQRLRKEKFSISTVRRKQTAEQRTIEIERWKKNRQVLLGTTGVLGTGVDGLQEASRYCIFVDREWTASDNEQAEKRIYRTGQTKRVIIYILQAIGTVDIQIERVQWDKGNDARILLEPVAEDEE